jgi:xylulokinase
MPTGSTIAGMGVSGVGPCLVLCDDDLRPLRPAILYGIDTRSSAEIDLLTEEFGADAIVEQAGTVLSSQAVGPKLEWVRRQEPDVFERATRWYGSNSYITAKLTGEYVMDHHTASQCDPLYATRRFDWNTQWAQRICGHLPLPKLMWPSDVIGAVTATAAAATGVPVGTPVIAGTVDAYAEAFSVGVRQPGDRMLMYGSTCSWSRSSTRSSPIPRCGRRRVWSAAPWLSPRARRRRAASSDGCRQSPATRRSRP